MDKFVHLTIFEGRLYRYQPYYGKYIDYINDLILNNNIFYSCPLWFNDPFDCKMYGIKFGEVSIESFMRERLKEKIQEIDKFFPKGMRRPSPAQASAAFEKTIQTTREQTFEDCAKAIQELHKLVENEISVLCLSSDPLNILMYSHYADRHRGICLEFTLQKNNIFNPEPVRYVRDFPVLDFGLSHDVNNALAVALVATKSVDWAYEKEHRSLKGGGSGIMEIPDNYLTGIIFGCAASVETIKTVMDVVKQSGKAIKLYRAVKCDSAFSLSLEVV